MIGCYGACRSTPARSFHFGPPVESGAPPLNLLILVVKEAVGVFSGRAGAPTRPTNLRSAPQGYTPGLSSSREMFLISLTQTSGVSEAAPSTNRLITLHMAELNPPMFMTSSGVSGAWVVW